MAGVVGLWHGTEAEAIALKVAIEHNCTCKLPSGCCESHAMLKDGSTLAHLLFVRRCSGLFKAGEWDVETRS